MARKTKRPDDWVRLITDEATNMTLGAWLDTEGYPRSAMKTLFQEKLVLVNDRKANPKTIVTSGDELRLQMPKETIDHEPMEGPLTIAYEDEDLLIVDKPVGLTVNSAGQESMANRIAAYFKAQKEWRKVRFLNRLDRDTSGLLIVAKSGLAQSLYQQQLEGNTLEKWYTAEVVGRLEGDGVIELPMRRSNDGIHYEVHKEGKLTKTAYTVITAGDDVSTVCIRLYTGKTHQIRVAMAHIGHPLRYDSLYGTAVEGKTFSLRASKVCFTSLRTGQRVEVEV